MNDTLMNVIAGVKRNYKRSLESDPNLISFFDQNSAMVRNIYKECGVEMNEEKAVLAIIGLGILSERAEAYSDPDLIRMTAIETSLFFVPWLSEN